MKVDITYDNKFLILSSDYIFELNVIRNAFTREIPNAWMLKKITSILNTEKCFMNNYNMIPVGLWLELIKISKLHNIVLELTDNALKYINSFQLNEDDFNKYVNYIFEDAVNESGLPFKPYDYQIKAAYNLLKYKKCCGEISTSAGKTLISFIIFKYLIDVLKIQNILYIVPSVDLATQSAEKYELYESYLKKHDNKWNIGVLKSGLNKKEKEAVYSCNILFGTYLSLCKKQQDFFNKYEACISDECIDKDSLIIMGDNTKKKISEVKIGDYVKSFNEKTKCIENHKVEFVYKGLSKNEKLYKLTVKSLLSIVTDIMDNELKITGNHKVFTLNGWKRVDELTINDEILTYDNVYYKVKKIECIGIADEEVYNLRIKDDYCHNYFANDLCVSNCHHNSNASIKNISNKLCNLKYSIGVTGTFPKEKLYEYLVLQAYIGPVIYKFTADQLIHEEKRGTPIFTIFQYMNWATDEEKQALYLLRANKNNDDIQSGNRILKQERLFVNNSYTRLKFICDKVIEMKKNTLVLFGDIKYGYGTKLYEYIKNNSDKNVYYVDGNTKNENREYYKQCMEDDLDGNTVIVASIMTFGEGIDLKNLWAIFLVDTSKSERIVRQICGRGLRLFPGKDKVILFDFVDDLRYSLHPKKYYKDNYLWKHGLERKKIYQEQKFPIYELKIKFS